MAKRVRVRAHRRGKSLIRTFYRAEAAEKKLSRMKSSASGAGFGKMPNTHSKRYRSIQKRLNAVQKYKGELHKQIYAKLRKAHPYRDHFMTKRNSYSVHDEYPKSMVPLRRRPRWGD